MAYPPYLAYQRYLPYPPHQPYPCYRRPMRIFLALAALACALGVLLVIIALLS